MKQVAIAVDVPAGVAVTADAGQVRKIVYNLMRNAIEHAAGSVNVNARLDGGMVNVSVIDDGDGPAADALPHLFDPFYSGRDAGRGRGLGLATAWRFARENGGALRFERVDDRTVFIVALPWADLQSQRISA
jgi:signal transduction histidine kinase